MIAREDSTDGTRGPGRPRSTSADRALLDAVLDLLAEGGFGRLTMEAIAARAEVGKTTLYRRWRSPAEVVAAAVEDFVTDIRVPDTGKVAEDLLILMRQAVEVYRGRPGRVLPGLIAAMAESDAVAQAVRDGFLRERRAALATVLERGVTRGELRPGTDFELALDVLGGPLFYRILVTGGPLDDQLAQGIVDTMLRGLATAADSKEDS